MFLTTHNKKRDAHNRKRGGQKETRENTFRPSLSLSAACAAAATRGAPFEKAEEAEELACDFISSALSK